MKNFILVSPNFPVTYWQFARALKNVGFRVLAIADCGYNDLHEEIKRSITEFYHVDNMNNYDDMFRAVAYFSYKYGHIDFIESNNEHWLRMDSRLRLDFNITTGKTINEIDMYQSKSLEKKYYQKAKVKTARWALPKDSTEAFKFIGEVGYPVIVKPDIGVGASSTTKLKNSEDVINFFNNKDDVVYIMEEYIDGELISFDGITNDKAEVVFYSNEVFTTPIMDIVNENKDTVYYSNKECPKDLYDAGKRTLKAFNAYNRYFHLEFFRLKEDKEGLGKKGELLGLETNMRAPGGFTPDLINFSKSVNTYEIFADTMMNRYPTYNNSYEKFYCIYASQRYVNSYMHNREDILNKYRNNIVMHDIMPLNIADDMGNESFVAKFKTIEEAFEFSNYVIEKNN